MECPWPLCSALGSIKAPPDDVHEIFPFRGRHWVEATIVSALPRTFTFVPARGSLFTKAWTNSSGPMCLSRSCMGRGEESERREGHTLGRRLLLGAIKGTVRVASVAGRCQLPSITSLWGPFSLCIYTEPHVLGVRSAHSYYQHGGLSCCSGKLGEQPLLLPVPCVWGPNGKLLRSGKTTQ